MSEVKSPSDFFSFAKQQGAEHVDMKFCDMFGSWQHCSYPIETLDEGVFEDGFGFDGSSIRGWQAINESDMLVVPQPETAFLDPFTELPTLVMVCNIQDPITREDYSRDPRNVARKAVNHLKSTGIADTAFFGDVSAGDPIPYIPENQLQLSAGLETSVWQVNASISYVDEVCTLASCGQFDRTDDALTLDLAANYLLNNKVKLFSRLENASDEQDILGRQPYGARPNKGRTASIGIEMSF